MCGGASVGVCGRVRGARVCVCPRARVSGAGSGVGGVAKNMFTLLDLCVSSLRRGHANLLCTVPILTDDPRSESTRKGKQKSKALPKVRNNITATQWRIAGWAERQT